LNKWSLMLIGIEMEELTMMSLLGQSPCNTLKFDWCSQRYNSLICYYLFMTLKYLIINNIYLIIESIDRNILLLTI
jgi:hypothetical protein